MYIVKVPNGAEWLRVVRIATVAGRGAVRGRGGMRRRSIDFIHPLSPLTLRQCECAERVLTERSSVDRRGKQRPNTNKRFVHTTGLNNYFSWPIHYILFKY